MKVFSQKHQKTFGRLKQNAYLCIKQAMKELKCPKCGNFIKIDEADYAFMVGQVRNAEFEHELNLRIAEFETRYKVEANLAAKNVEQDYVTKLNDKDLIVREMQAEIKNLKHELENTENRKAKFHTVFALIIDGKEHLFEGTVKGEITKIHKGTFGFGYDPIFKPEGYQQTFAEMGHEEKNKISHRAKATEKLCKFLKSI